jgi:hypothetical protein
LFVSSAVKVEETERRGSQIGLRRGNLMIMRSASGFLLATIAATRPIAVQRTLIDTIRIHFMRSNNGVG